MATFFQKFSRSFEGLHGMHNGWTNSSEGQAKMVSGWWSMLRAPSWRYSWFGGCFGCLFFASGHLVSSRL